MRTRNKKILLALLTLFFIVFSFSTTANVAFAAEYESYPEGFKVLPDCYKDGICDLDDFVQLFVNLSQVALKILPYLAMVFMIWAGFNLIMAAGNPEKIQEGKKMLTSIIVGILIVTILAWTWSLFIVVVLTGSLEGKIFPGTPLEREWWGGGTVAGLAPEEGCCVVDGYGCIEVTKEECESYPAIWFVVGMTPPVVNFMGEQQYCYEFVAACSKWTLGCCVPRYEEDTTCYEPTQKGCLEWPFTEHTPNRCLNIEQCDKDKIVSGDTAVGESATGCCVEQHECSTKNYSECAGNFYAEQSCDSVEGCSGGCCVSAHGCTSGKDGCKGEWNAEECDEGDNDPNGAGARYCTIGCCEAPPAAIGMTCYTNYTWYACDTLLGGSLNPTSDCTNNTECTSGCCLATCIDGNIDGACPNPLTNYAKGMSCNLMPNCATGCCLQDGASRCVENILNRDCQDPGDDWVLSACDTGAGGVCEEGCCSDPTQDYRCIDGYSQWRCSGVPNGNGGTFYGNGQVCNDLNVTGHQCELGGSCTTIIDGCFNLTSSQTRGYCTSLAGNYDSNPC